MVLSELKEILSKQNNIVLYLNGFSLGYYVNHNFWTSELYDDKEVLSLTSKRVDFLNIPIYEITLKD